MCRFPQVSHALWLVISVYLLSFVGCSDRLGAQVSGTVTLDDKPLPRGNVSFHPVRGGAVAYGTISDKGEYTVSTGAATGMAPGEYSVTVVATEALSPTAASEPEAVPKLITPEKYGDTATTDLKAEVKPGKNTVPLKLISSPTMP